MGPGPLGSCRFDAFMAWGKIDNRKVARFTVQTLFRVHLRLDGDGVRRSTRNQNNHSADATVRTVLCFLGNRLTTTQEGPADHWCIICQTAEDAVEDGSLIEASPHSCSFNLHTWVAVVNQILPWDPLGKGPGPTCYVHCGFWAFGLPRLRW